MANEIYRHATLIGCEALLVAALLLAFFRFRRILGLVPLHATLAALYQLATVMAGALCVQLSDGRLMMNPSAAVLLPASVFALLLIHIREDAREARRVAYGLLAANAVVGIMGLLVGQHLRGAMVFNLVGVPGEFFEEQPRLVAAGAVALLADIGIVIGAYDYLGRFWSKLPFLRIYAAAALALVADTLLFVGGAFPGSPHFASLAESAILGKLSAGLLYAFVIALHLRLLARRERVEEQRVAADPLLTYREKYEALRKQSTRDPLTGVLHRGAFEALIGAQIARACRSGKPMTLLVVDIDRFKEVNDLFGHQAGDDVLRSVARTLQASVRDSDFVCRFGGEEFAILLPDIAAGEALGLAERMRAAVTRDCRADTPVGKARSLTVCIGLATAPGEETHAEALIALAGRRLYEAKRAGCDRIASTGMFAPLPALGTAA